MAASKTKTLLHRSQTLLRPFSTTTTTTSPPPNHDFLSPNTYLSSWAQPTSPKQAQAQLAHLRRDYARKLKTVRKEYIQEMEMQRAEKARKDEAIKESLRVSNEARRAAKAADKALRAAQREAADHQFRLTLLKERAEKLEYWKMRVEKVEEKKKKAEEDVRNRSSMWTDEAEIEEKIERAINGFFQF